MIESVTEKPTRLGQLPRRLIGGGIWVVVGRIGGIGLLLVSNITLARLLSPEEFGLFILATSAIVFVSIPARLGLDWVIIRFLSACFAENDVHRAKKTLKACAVLALLSTGAVCLAWGLFVFFFGGAIGLPTGWKMVSINILGVAAITVMNVTAESFRGFHELRFSSLFNAVNGPLIGCIFLGLIVLVAATTTLSFELALVAYVASFAIVIPFALLCFQRMFSRYAAQLKTIVVAEPNQKASQETQHLSLPQLAIICVPIMLTQLMAFGSNRGDVFVAGAICSQDELALYAAVCRLILIVVIPLNMVNLTVSSTISELYAQRQTARLQRTLQQSATLAAIPSIVTLIAIVVFPEFTMSIVFGPFYESAAAVLIVLTLGRIASCLTGSCQMTLVMTGHHNFELIVNIASFAGLVILGSLAANHLGIIGLAIASTSIFVLKNIASWLLARRLVGVWTNASLSPTLWISRSRQLE